MEFRENITMKGNEYAIMEYAKSHRQFKTNEILAHLSEKMAITKSSLFWYLNMLTQKQRLARIGHGLYAIADKKMFKPIPSEEVVNIYTYIKKLFPFAHFCIYEGSILSSLQHHLSQNNIIYIETDREAVETVFNQLKEQGKTAYIKPSKDLIYRYIDMGERACFVKPLVSESPLQIIQNIPMPTIEKLLIDIRKDADFFYLQGIESNYILENAFYLYTINESKLLRYAWRRGIKEEIKSQINLLKDQ